MKGSWLITVNYCLVQSRVKKPRRRALGFTYNLCRLSGPHGTLGEFRGDICFPLLWILNSEWVGPHFEKSGDALYIELLLIVIVLCKSFSSPPSSWMNLQGSWFFFSQVVLVNYFSFRCMSALSLLQWTILSGICLKNSLGYIDSRYKSSHCSWKQLDFSFESLTFWVPFYNACANLHIDTASLPVARCPCKPQSLSLTQLHPALDLTWLIIFAKGQTAFCLLYSLKIRIKRMHFILKTMS